MIITIFNRKELIITYSFERQAEIRKMLAHNNIDYYVNPIMFSLDIFRCDAEYKIYVKKKDYEKARSIIDKLLD